MSTWMITGHRQLPESRLTWIDAELRRVFARLHAEQGMRRLATGMALGADMMAVEAIESVDLGNDADGEARIVGRVCPFTAFVPWPGQAARWRQRDRVRWWTMLGRASQVQVTSAWRADPWTARFVAGAKAEKFAKRTVLPATFKPGSPGRSDVIACLHARNDAMLAESEGVVALWDGRASGGTASAVMKARRAGLPVVVISPDGSTTRMLRGAALVQTASA